MKQKNCSNLTKSELSTLYFSIAAAFFFHSNGNSKTTLTSAEHIAVNLNCKVALSHLGKTLNTNSNTMLVSHGL